MKILTLILMLAGASACASTAAPEAKKPEPYVLKGEAPDVLTVHPDGRILLKGKEIGRDADAFRLFQRIEANIQGMAGQIQSCQGELEKAKVKGGN